MTKIEMRDTIDMAREAGWKDLRDYDSEMRNDIFMGNTDSLKAFEALVRADERDRAMRENAYVQAEREACAKVCDEQANELYESRAHHKCAEYLAEQIRARGQA
jgi:hypothetical protein